MSASPPTLWYPESFPRHTLHGVMTGRGESSFVEVVGGMTTARPFTAEERARFLSGRVGGDGYVPPELLVRGLTACPALARSRVGSPVYRALSSCPGPGNDKQKHTCHHRYASTCNAIARRVFLRQLNWQCLRRTYTLWLKKARVPHTVLHNEWGYNTNRARLWAPEWACLVCSRTEVSATHRRRLLDLCVKDPAVLSAMSTLRAIGGDVFSLLSSTRRSAGRG